MCNKYDVMILPPKAIEKFEKVDVAVNTASLTEMSEKSIQYYIKHINRIANYFYKDNHLNINADTLYRELNNSCYDLELVSAKTTPLNYLDTMWRGWYYDFQEKKFPNNLL